MAPISDKQTRLLIIMILFVGVVAGYVYYSRFTSVVIDEPIATTDNSKDTLAQFKNLKFDFQIFSSSNIKPLKIFGEVPVIPDKTGRVNPFANF